MIRFTILCVFVGLVLIACEKEEVSLPADTLSVTRFQPLAALANDTITIFGTGFSTNVIENVVQFTYPDGTKVSDQILATVINAEESKLQVVVPANAQIGKVKVGVGPYTALSEIPFLLSPSISSVNPNAALPGDQITIQGRNFTADLSKLLVFIGNTRIDSLFGGSSTQVVFPLPEGFAPGETTVRVGILLTPKDTVLAPAVPFTLYDPNKPTITNVSPQTILPGGEITINGNAFKPKEGSATVTLTYDGGQSVITQDNFTEQRNNLIKFNLPVELENAVKGKEQLTINVSVTIVIAEATLVSEAPAKFTLLEPSDLVFYFTELNKPGFSNDDDSLFQANPLPNGGAIRKALASGNLGIDADEANGLIYFAQNTQINKIKIDDEQITPLNMPSYFNTADISFDAVSNKLYYYAKEDYALVQYDLSTETAVALVEGTDLITSIKFNADDNKIYWAEKFDFGSKYAKIKCLLNGSVQELYVNNTIANHYVVGVAVGTDKIYFAEGPTDPSSLSNASGNSKIFSINKDGSNVQKLYDIGGSITDLEISKDGKTLYWMASGETGAIMSGSNTTGGTISTIIPSIRNGRYIEVIEKE